MDLKSNVLYVLAIIGGIATLFGNIKTIRDAIPFFRRYPWQIISVALFVAGVSIGVLSEKRIADRRQIWLSTCQNSFGNLQQKYESLPGAPGSRPGVGR